MLQCKKCHRGLEERTAQQALSEMEDVLLVCDSPIAARQKLRGQGPLCDRCLVHWFRGQSERATPAIQRGPGQGFGSPRSSAP